MKRTIAALLALMMLLCLTACGEKDEDENADSDKKPSTASTTKKEAPSAPEWVLVQELGPQGEVLAEYEYDQNGNQTAKRSYLMYSEELDTENSWEKVYDESGKVIEKYQLYQDGTSEREFGEGSFYEYDKNGNCVKEKIQSSFFLSYYEMTYDKDGKLTEKAYYDDGTLRSAIRYTYDEKGNCETSREYEIYDDEETIKWTSADTWNKEYNEKGQEIKCTHYGETGVERYRQEFAYDEKGNQTEMRWYALNRLSMEDSWDKEYDENGNCVKQIEFGPDGTEYLKREYRYARFENGAVVTTVPAVTTTTAAPTTTAAKKIGYATDALNVRRDASTDHDRVGMLKKGDAVTIIGEEGDFYKIEYKWTQEGSSGDYAFVSKEYVSDKKPG